jgi:hypothetical protein
MILGLSAGLTAWGGRAAGQDSAIQRGHGLTSAEAAAGWLSLFDGKTTFGWSGAKLNGGRLVGGTTTTEIGDCELRGDVELDGTLVVGGRTVTVGAGRLVIPSTGRSGRIRLGDRVAVRTLAVKPRHLKTLFGGRSLVGCAPIKPAKARPGSGPTWAIEGVCSTRKAAPARWSSPGPMPISCSRSWCGPGAGTPTAASSSATRPARA